MQTSKKGFLVGFIAGSFSLIGFIVSVLLSKLLANEQDQFVVFSVLAIFLCAGSVPAAILLTDWFLDE